MYEQSYAIWLKTTILYAILPLHYCTLHWAWCENEYRKYYVSVMCITVHLIPWKWFRATWYIRFKVLNLPYSKSSILRNQNIPGNRDTGTWAFWNYRYIIIRIPYVKWHKGADMYPDGTRNLVPGTWYQGNHRYGQGVRIITGRYGVYQVQYSTYLVLRIRYQVPVLDTSILPVCDI